MKNELKCIDDVKVMNNSFIAITSHQPVNIPDGKYEIQIQDIPRKRTLKQNSYLWALIGEIAKKEDGDLRDIDTLYCHLLEMAGAKYKVIYGDLEAIEELRSYGIIRHIAIKRRQVINHKVTVEAWIFYGSSKMDTNEMAELIDTTLRYASEFEINTPYWEELLKG